MRRKEGKKEKGGRKGENVRGRERSIIERINRYRLTTNLPPSAFNIDVKVLVNGVANTY